MRRTPLPLPTTFGALARTAVLLLAGQVAAATVWAQDPPPVQRSGAQIEGNLIRGLILDEDTGLPVQSALITLYDEDGDQIAEEVESNAEGRWSIPLPPPGIYRIRVRRLGYGSAATERFEIPEGEDRVSVQIALTADAFDLGTIDVLGRARPVIPQSMIEEFRLRAENGIGSYIEREDLEERYRGMRFEDLLRQMPFVEYAGDAGQRIIVARRGAELCPIRWYLNGQPFATEDIPPGIPSPFRILSEREIEGIELYRGFAEIPIEFRPFPGDPACAVVLVWTRVGGGIGRGGGGGG